MTAWTKVKAYEDIIYEKTDLLERTQALFFRAGGRRVRDGGWPEGTYSAEVTFLRGDTVLDQASLNIATE